jgi:hypothetical protein
MVRLGTRTMKLASLVMPGDFRQRLEAARVKDLAESFARVPLLQRPGVRARDKKVIFGGDRLAALSVAGETWVEVDLWDCTDAEMAEARDTENARRRERDEAALRRLVERRAAEEEAAEEVPWDTGADVSDVTNGPARAEMLQSKQLPPDAEMRRGRRKTPAGRAREAVAKQAGTTPKAVKEVEQRAKAREGRIRHDDTVVPPPPVETHGIRADDDTAAAIRLIHNSLHSIDLILRRAKTELSGFLGVLEKVTAALTVQLDAQELARVLDEATRVVRGAKPSDLCVYCALVPSERKRCAACRGSGYLTADQMRSVPKELNGTQIYVNGKLRKVAEVGR